MSRAAALAAVVLAGLLGCTRPADSPAAAVGRQLVGAPYRLGGLWFYPREDFALAETGLASVIADPSPGRRTANGEAYDPEALLAAHRTLQLPAVLRVTNLETGRALSVRVNDRGPADPGRVVALSRRAAALLGVSPDRPAQVRIAVEDAASRASAAALPGGAPGLAIAAAPVGAVQRESLAPPPGAVQSANPRQARAPATLSFAAAADGPAALVGPPESVSDVPAAPGRLLVQAGTFGGADMARRQAATLPGARAEAFSAGGAGRRPEWRVRLGPFGSSGEADSALERVLRSGVSEARILVD